MSTTVSIWPAVMVHGAQRAYAVALSAVLKDPNVCAILCIAIAPTPDFSFLDVAEILNAVLEECPPTVPVVAWTYGPDTKRIAEKLESKKRIVAYPSLETATWALSLLRDRHKTTQERS